VKNIKCIPAYIPIILLFFAISCRKDTTDGTAMLPPCSSCANGGNSAPANDWRLIEIKSADWNLDSAGLASSYIQDKVNAVNPWDYTEYTYPYIGFDYGTNSPQFLKQGDSLARNGGLFFLDGYDIVFKSQTNSPPDSIYIWVWLIPKK